MQTSALQLIVFRTGCHPNIGTGHLRRCMTLADELISRGLDVCLVTEDNALSREIIGGYHGAVIEYVSSHLLLPDRISVPGVLVLDLPPSSNSLLGQQNVLSRLSFLNDFGVNIISLGHVSLNSQNFRAVIDLYPSQKIHAANYFEGPEYLILRPEFMADPGDSEKEPCVLISMGGSDPHDLTETALTNLMDSGYRGKVIVVLGAGYSSEREANLQKKIKTSRFLSRFHRNIKDMRALMRRSTAAIVAFGTTAYELMSQRVPVLAYSHYHWQVPSTKLFEELGCCVYLGCAEIPGERISLSSKVKEVLHEPDLMRQMAQKARKIVDGKGVARVADIVENMVSPEEDKQLLDTLFVLAHPGDELLGCGGTLLRHVHHNHKVGLVILGDGVSSRRKESDDATALMIAKKELRAALQAVVERLNLATWYYFRFEDNRFDKHDLLELIKVLEPVFKRHNPRIVYTNHSGDLNIDHRRTFEAVATALRPDSGRRLTSLFSVEVPTSTDWGVSGNAFRPNWFVDISPHLEEKLDLLMLYKSELRQEPHPRSLEAIRDRAVQWGRFCGQDAAEAFVLHRHVQREND